MEGREIDIMSAIAHRLGLQPHWRDTGGFDNIIPGLSTGRYDAALANLDATLERLKKIDFVAYFDSNRLALVTQGDPDGKAKPVLTNLGDLCGQTAYACEIIRGGIIGVARTQTEAARALGMTRAQVILRIVMPQAMRTIIPPAGNQVIGQLKTTAVASVIALQDPLYSAQIVYQRTYEIIPLLLVASLWYIALKSVLSVAQFGIERHFGRGFSRRPVPRAAHWQSLLRRKSPG